MEVKKYIEKVIAITSSFLDRLIGILIPMRFPLAYKGTDIDEFRRLMSWLWDKNLDSLLRCVDIYVGISLEDELKSRMSWGRTDNNIELKLQWVAGFKETIEAYVQTRSIRK